VSLANTLIEPLVSDAEALAAAGFATPEDINIAMRLGAGHPRGPLPDVQPDTEGSAEPPSQVPARVAVIGTGTMATGMVEVFARAGAMTTVIGLTAANSALALETIDKRLTRAVELGKLDAATRAMTLANIRPAVGLDICAESDFVIEAITEDLQLKRALFAELEQATSDIPLATNTSSFRVGEISESLTQPERLFAFHFFNPAPAMRLIEVVGGDQSDPALVPLGVAWARGVVKVPVTCGDDTGFIVNRLLVPYLNDAARVCGELRVDWSVADAAVRDELGHPMGPFQLMDLIGLDVMVSAVQTMHRRFESDRYAPAPALLEQVAAARLGRKSGAGFFDYEERR
jgi:3-hydroxybutyryl-CoA dehydrogenase